MATNAIGLAPQPPASAQAVDRMARHFATLDPVQAEAILDARVAEAVRGWRLEEATHWQKIKYKARWLRGMAKRAEGTLRARSGETG